MFLHSFHVSPKTVDRLIWVLAGLVLVGLISFGAYYYRDRYYRRGPSLVDVETAHLEALIRQNPADALLRVEVAKRYLARDMLDAAIQQANEALKINPSMEEAYLVLGDAYRLQGDLDAALAQYQKVVTLNEDNEFAAINPNLETAYYEIGEIHLGRGELEQARDAFLAALKIERTDADALLGLGITYQRLGEHEKALDTFHRAVRLVPKFPEVYEAMRASYEALQEPAGVRYTEGMLYYAQGMPEKALPVLEEGIRMNPDFIELYFGLGLVHEALGNTEAAIEALNRYLEVHPDDVAAQFAIHRLTGVPPTATVPGQRGAK